MPVTRDEAAQALKEVEQTQSLSGQLLGYESAAPHFFVWGLVWMLGYAGTNFAPDQKNLIWGVVIGIGSLLSILLGRRQGGGGSPALWRSIAISCLVMAFVGGLMFAMKYFDQRQSLAVIPLAFAAFYTLFGLAVGVRFVICGLVLGFGTVLGYFLAGDFFGYWMAVVGGGCLLVTGLWLRRV